MVAKALEVGYRHIDTAAMYGNEEAVGEGLRAAGVPREEVFVTTKVWHTDLADGALQLSAEASLKRLGLDQVDLLLIHWPSATVPVADAVGSLNDALDRGLTRAIGISNHPVALIEEAVAASRAPLAVNQVEYHPLLDHTPVLEALRRHEMALTAYSPLAQGKLAGNATLARVGAAHGLTATQTALAWLLNQDIVIAIPRTSNPGRLAENFAAREVRLSQAEMDEISALASPRGRLVSPAWAPRWD
jgi:diketogulonate reductase-like aldo/keto reductase